MIAFRPEFYMTAGGWWPGQSILRNINQQAQLLYYDTSTWVLGIPIIVVCSVVQVDVQVDAKSSAGMMQPDPHRDMTNV